VQSVTCIVLITTVVYVSDFCSHCKHHVCKDGDTRVGAEDADDAEELDIGI